MLGSKAYCNCKAEDAIAGELVLLVAAFGVKGANMQLQRQRSNKPEIKMQSQAN